MTENLTETFVAKVDAFAASLAPEEQAMLVELLTSSSDADDVAGFRGTAGWPGLGSLGVWKSPAGLDQAHIGNSGGIGVVDRDHGMFILPDGHMRPAGS